MIRLGNNGMKCAYVYRTPHVKNRCNGFVYEDGTYIDGNGIKMLELLCINCGRGIDVELKKWKRFKKKLGSKLGVPVR